MRHVYFATSVLPSLHSPGFTDACLKGWVWKTKDHNKPINIYWDETLSNKVLTVRDETSIVLVSF